MTTREIPVVPVRTALRPSTWRAFEDRAKELRCTVGELLSVIADNAVTPKSRPKRTYVRMTPERLVELHRLHAAGKSQAEIARALGVSPASVSNHLTNRKDAP